jgi:glycosyltransferase involved in cell wall biosynthesis
VRIAYLHQYFVPPTAAGGTRSFEFVKRLLAKGHEVRVITSRAHLQAGDVKPREWGIDREDNLQVSVINVDYSHWMQYSARLRAFFKFAVMASLKVCEWRPDVVFATSTPLTIAIPAGVAKKVLRVPMVFEVRDLWPEIPIAVGALKHPVAVWAARVLERFAYRNADEIVALSPGMRDGIMAAGVPGDKVTVIPNASDNALFDVPRERGARYRAQVAGLPADCPLLVYAGTFGRINRVGYLVDLAVGLRRIGSPIGVLLVGDGVERSAVTEAARQSGVLGRGVWLSEPVPKQQLPDVLSAATVCTSVVAPIRALQHNSANKFFDALAAGKPVAINYGGWQAELLQESGAGLVLPADDPLEAARQLHAFVSDPARLAAAGAAARKLARERFDRDRLAVEFESVLVRAVSRTA